MVRLPDGSLRQSSLGTQFGGLGLRKASDLRLPAFIASRSASKALVFRLADALNNVGMLPETFESEFNTNSMVLLVHLSLWSGTRTQERLTN